MQEPRSLKWRAVSVVLSLAVLGAGVGLRAQAAPAPDVDAAKKKQDPKKDDGKKGEPKKGDGKDDAPEFPRVPNGLPQGADFEQLRMAHQEMVNLMQQLHAQVGHGGGSPFGVLGFHESGRLGARVQKPSATLAEQLDLPKGQGLVVEDVQADSAAAKAGIKAHDILLELNGKPVPDGVQELAKALEDIKPDTPVEAVVLRKGKRETIKGLSLPEAKAAVTPFGNFNLPQFPQGPFGGGLPMLKPLLGGGNGVMVTTFRTGDHFTTRHQEGSLIITVSGSVADGKAKVSEIQVQDGTKSDKYESVDKVPEAYRDKVKNLVEMSEKNNAKIEIRHE
jgi:hypothetical protein